MKNLFRLCIVLTVLGVGMTALSAAAPDLPQEKVAVVQDAKGWRLQIDGEDFEVKGVVWSYTPIGQNYTYDLWAQPQDFIERVINTDMKLIAAMGANTIRVFTMVPPQWVEYIYDRFGIHTLVNDLFGRYGVEVDGRWQFPTNYADPATRRTLLEQAKKNFETYRNTRGVLMFMLGNESNYGLEWTSSAIENLPGGEQAAYKAKALYSLFEEALALGKTLDANHPMGLINGDLQYMKELAAEVKSLDILGVNTYRGPKSFDNFYQSIKTQLNKPFIYTEFGADAYNVVAKREDQGNHALLLRSQWQEVYEQAWGKGKTGNCLGGYVFEWMDEWWKNGMEVGLDTHETTATWNNGAYEFDSVDGLNNMNEEWFGLVAQSKLTDQGVNRRLPRAGYYVLQDLWGLPLYSSTPDQVKARFAAVDFNAARLSGEANTSHDPTTDPLPLVELHGQVDVAGFWKTTDVAWLARHLEGGVVNYQATSTQSIIIRPVEGLSGGLTVRLATDPANATTVDLVETSENAGVKAAGIEFYQAWLQFKSPILDINGYYHTGHPDWVTKGDFFGLLPESYDLVGMNKGYRSYAPFGIEINFKDFLDGLTLYGGPEIYWGAKPSVIAKYFRNFGPLGLGLMFDQELAPATNLLDSAKSKKVDNWTSLYGSLDLTWLKVDLGGLLARPDRVILGKDTYTSSSKSSGAGYMNSGYDFGLLTKFSLIDSIAGKIRVSTNAIPYVQLAVQYLYAGVLADTREATAREGSQLADSGSGNRHEILAKLGFTFGDFNLTTRFLYRVPLLDALPAIDGLIQPRSAMKDQFIVWGNRKAIQGEALLTFDPTGATYFYDWNNEDRENAVFAASLGLLYNFYLGPTDVQKFLAADNVTWYDFSGPLPEVSNTWSLKARIISAPFPGLKIAAEGKAGNEQASGWDTAAISGRLINSWGFRIRTVVLDRLMLEGSWVRDGWGPDDWYRQWNVTYPDQWHVALSYGFKPISLLSETDRVTIGITGRNYDGHALKSGADTAGGVSQRLSGELAFGFSW